MYGRKMQGGIAAIHVQWRRLPAALILLMLSALLGCGKATAPQQEQLPMDDGVMSLEMRRQLHKAFAHVAPPQAYAALATLGAPAAEGAGSHQSAVVIPHTFDANKQYTKAGKSGYIGMSADAVLTPGSPPVGHVDLNPPSSTFPGNFGYALYRVDGISQAVRTLRVTLGPSSGFVGVGVYNWAYGSLGRWEPRYFAAPAPSFDVALDDVAGADYTDSRGNLAFVVFCLRGSTLTIRSFELSDVSSNQPPFANVFATICSSPAPLVTELDAHNSSDDGTIVKYRFDPEGHNQWIDNGANPVLQYVYTDPGPYIPRVEVTDNLGLVSRAPADAVICEPEAFDEVEQDDDFATANPVTLPFSLFSGNVGAAGSWDGDEDDFYTFNANADDKIQFSCYYCRVPGPVNNFNLTLALYDSDDPDLPLTTGDFNVLPAFLWYTVKETDVGPFYLKLLNTSGFSYSYYLAGGPLQLEIEDNDSPEDVAWQPSSFTAPLLANKQVSGWNGSIGLGPDYQGNDGDDDDWLYLTAGPGNTVDITIDYNPVTGNVGATLFDGFAEVLANSSDADGQEHITYTFSENDPNPILLHIAALAGSYSDYSISATLDTPNPGLDELEDNDSPGTATPLPAFPFSGFTGNVGRGGSYDQDVIDFLSISSAPGDMLRFTVTPSVQMPTWLKVTIRDSATPAYTYAPEAEDEQTGVQQIVTVAKANGETPYYLELDNFGFDPNSPVNYSMDGELVTAYDEVEDNDLRPQATELPQGAQFTFAGSLGSGGYDGDLVDWLTFTADIGEQPVFYLLYDDSTLSFDMQADPPTVEDEAGDVVAAGVVDPNSKAVRLTFQKPIDINDLSPFYLKINGKTGASNYWIQRTE